MDKEVSYYDGEDEITISLPHVFEVCSRCQGHGTHLTPSIGMHAYSMEEFQESFYDEEDREQYFTRGGIYDVTCEICHGERVVAVVDENACKSRGLLAELTQYQHWLDQEASWAAEQRAEIRRESMMMGDY